MPTLWTLGFCSPVVGDQLKEAGATIFKLNREWSWKVA